jgi:hypothetical protein
MCCTIRNPLMSRPRQRLPAQAVVGLWGVVGGLHDAAGILIGDFVRHRAHRRGHLLGVLRHDPDRAHVALVYDVRGYRFDNHLVTGDGEELFIVQPLALRKNEITGDRLPADETDQLVDFVLKQKTTFFPLGLFEEPTYAFKINVDIHLLINLLLSQLLHAFP